MERLVGKLRKFCYRRTAAVLAAVVLFVGALVGGYLFMPKVSAETGDTADNPIILEQGKTVQAKSGKYYAIAAGTYNVNTATDAFTLIHPGTTDKVHLIIGYDASKNSQTQEKGATINLNADCSAIVLTGTANEENKFDAQFNVEIHGENKIVSTFGGATQPLIDTTSTSYKIDVVDKFSSSSDYFVESSVVRNVSVNFVSPLSPNSVLRLETAPNSTGAAIGTPELSEVARVYLSTGIATVGGGGGTVSVDRDGDGIAETYTHSQQLYLGSFKAHPGTITVQKYVNLIINGKGHGAGIGTGASQDNEVKVKYKPAGGSMTELEKVSAADMGSTRDVTISGGTVTIQMADNSFGNCVGSGAIAGSANKEGHLIVTGGSVRLIPGTNGYKYATVSNASGKAVYEYVFELGTALSVAENNKIAASDPREYVLRAEDGGDNDFLITSATDLTSADAYTANLGLQVDITSPNSADEFYSFEGYANKQFAALNIAAQQEKFYFYLPIASLQAHGISVEDDLPEQLEDIKYQYKAQGESDYRDFPEDCLLREGKTFSIKFKKSELPSYCTKVTYRIQTEDGLSEATALTVDDNDEYVFNSVVGSKDMKVVFSFELGTYDVHVDYNTATIENETLSETCGNNIELTTPTWEGRTFAGWYYDEEFTLPVEDSDSTDTLLTISSLIPDEEITVYAKWMCGVYLKDSDDTDIEVLTYQIGDTLTYDDVKGYNPADDEYQRFIGWEIPLEDETVFWEIDEGAENESITITGNVTLKACYEIIDYHIYIDGLYVDVENPEIKTEILLYPDTDFVMSVDKVLEAGTSFSDLKFTDVLLDVSEYSQTTEESKVQFKDIISGTITGYELKAVHAYPILENNTDGITLGEEIKEFAQISGDAFTFTMPAQDVYLTVEVETIPYKIEYFGTLPGEDVFMDMTPADLEGNPTVTEFNIKSPTFTLNPLVSDNKYYAFDGWYLMGDIEQKSITEITTGQFEQDIQLVAKWREVDTYPIVIDEACKEYIKVLDSDGIEIDKGIPGEKLEVVVTPGKGVYYNFIKYIYTVNGVQNDHKKTPSEPSKEQTSYFFTMEESESFFTGEFVLIDYTITYVNLLGAKNDNPLSYTVKDTIVLNAPEKEGYEFKEWTMVVPDESGDYASVKEVPITEIKDQTGNIMLVARWVDEDEQFVKYQVSVDTEAIINGDVEAFEKEAAKADYVFLKITANHGYVLKSIYYTMKQEATPLLARRAMLSEEAVTNVRYDLSFTEVSDGIYYIVMPEADINIGAEFEPISYNITYLNGEQKNNPFTYTIEDSIVLEAPEAKEGYQFLGWFDAEDKLVTNIEQMTGDILLVAKWEEEKVELPPVEEPTTKPETQEPETQEPETPAPTEPAPNYDNLFNQILGTLQQFVSQPSSENTQVEQPTEEPTTEPETQAPQVKPTIIGKAESLLQQIQTGDSSNIAQLLVICVVALLVVVVVMPKKKKDDDISMSEDESKME